MEINYLCQQKELIMNKQPQLMDVFRMRDILTLTSTEKGCHFLES